MNQSLWATAKARMTTNALPLVPPTGSKMTMAQCDAEISTLKEIHHTAIEEFWRNAAHAKINPQWSQEQLDLYKIFCAKAYGNGKFQSPDRDDVIAIWNGVISSLDIEIKEQMQMSDFASFDPVCVFTKENELILVHRYEGPQLSNLAEDDLNVSDDDGPYWFYNAYSYEPERFDRAAYSVACLYVIGAIDPETDQWKPKHLENLDMYDFRDRTRVMESLVDHNELNKYESAVALPAFPSGVETRLHELHLIREKMSRQSYSVTNEERLAIEAVSRPFNQPICDMQTKIKTLEAELDRQTKQKRVAELTAFLNFFGFECGQSVTHASSGETGFLKITESNRPCILIDVEGKIQPGWSSQHEIERQIRLGEWALADLPEVDLPRPKG